MNAPPPIIVIAVDGSENSRRAVDYVGRLFGGWKALAVTLLHVIHAPEEDFFATSGERDGWIRSGRQRAGKWMADYRQALIAFGLGANRVTLHIVERDGPSLSRLILNEIKLLGVGTLVVGRQGLTRKEEFLFGSVSKQIVSHARNCTVWVVQ